MTIYKKEQSRLQRALAESQEFCRQEAAKLKKALAEMGALGKAPVESKK